MANIIYLICGVPASGKTWVCKQLTEKYKYVAHDDHLKDFVGAVTRVSQTSDKPILSECPFGERKMKEKLENDGFHVVPIFIVETPEIIADRYINREGRSAPKAHLTRALSIRERAIEWGDFFGTSSEVLEHLKSL